MTEKLKRLKERLSDLEAQRYQNIKNGRYVMPALDKKIALVKAAIEDEEAYLPKKISDLIPEEVLKSENFNTKLIKVHIAADYLCDCAMESREVFEKLGLEEHYLLPLVRDIEKKAADYAAIVCHPQYVGLSEFMTTNEQLIDAMHGEVNNYIHKKLKIID